LEITKTKRVLGTFGQERKKMNRDGAQFVRVYRSGVKKWLIPSAWGGILFRSDGPPVVGCVKLGAYHLRANSNVV